MEGMGALKMQGVKMTDKQKLWIWKMQDWKMTDKLLAKTPNELRGLENDGPLFASHTSRKDSSHLVELGVF